MLKIENAENVKFRAGDRLVRGRILKDGQRIFLFTPYNKILLDEIKSFAGRRWHGNDDNPVKAWSIPNNARNRFQLTYLLGGNPYKNYDTELVTHDILYPEFEHQTHMINHILTVKQGIWAAEMGTGKTLSALVTMMESGHEDWWWFSTRSALYSALLDAKKWRLYAQENNLEKMVFLPKFYGTYDRLRSLIKETGSEITPPRGVVFDESSKLKTPNSQRSQAASILTERMREVYGDDCYIIEMTGTPAPKSPIDWWHQAEVACPGFLKEGNIHLFRNRLGIVEARENQIGSTYSHLVTWKDDPKKCNVCGELETSPDHYISLPDGSPNPYHHNFEPSVNEVEKLYRRLKGLVVVKFKKDCTDLPDKVYRIIETKPSAQMLQYATTIVNTAPRAVTGYMLLRELSDGFQYKDEVTGQETCKLCKGSGKYPNTKLKDGYEFQEDGTILELATQTALTNVENDPNLWEEDEEAVCYNCGGSGKTDIIKRDIVEIPTAKDKVLEDVLDEHDEIGRLVVYAGFTGSIDRIVKICLKNNWSVLRVDGRGYCGFGVGDRTTEELLTAFDNTHPHKDKYLKELPKLVFIGQPGAAGMGLNLTMSPTILYYSNDFNAEARQQSEDRIHRTGMDANRGATIIDIFNLESDRKIYDNLKMKRDLQHMSLGFFKNALKGDTVREYYDS